MKHGSHIMLQRFVRSIVRTDPRPWVTVLEPWLWRSLSLWARISRPGKTFSRWSKNSVSIAITSSKWPWIAQSFTIRILPSRDTIWALISPTFSLRRISPGNSPLTFFVRISGTHFGHKESVVRGQPSGGFCFSHDFRSGFSDHFGVKDAFGLIELKVLNTRHAAPGATVTAFSAYF